LKKVFLDYDQAALDRQYEQRTFVPHADEIIKRYGERSDEVRARIGEPQTLAYGTTPVEALDVYGQRRDTVVAFVHGGAWKRMGKRASAYAAETFVDAGASYVAIGFGLLPTITLPEMAGQVCRALEYIKKEFRPKRLVLIGHSSGGHLSACALARLDFIQSALVCSGVYDLLPVRLSARNEYVRLDERLEHEYSPIRHVQRIGCPVTVAWGEHEGPEFTRQSQEFADALSAAGKLRETVFGRGLNHFEVIETLADPRSPLGRAALNMLR
jgi:arylformamidase